MNERMGRIGRWLRSGNSIVVVDDAVSDDGAEIDELRLAGLVSPPQPLLRKGSRGSAVASIQRVLNIWAARSRPGLAPLKKDGIFGPLTEGRVITFQRANGLVADGIVGGRTLGALRTAIQRLSRLTIPASVVRESPCLSPNPIIPSTLPACHCVDGYKTDQDKVGKDQQTAVKNIAIFIARTRTLQAGGSRVNRVVIVGHTDSDGGSDFNFRLGMARARGVEQRLIEILSDLGVSAPFMKPESRGESEPIGSNNTAEGKAANRRVEVCLFG